jgi:hypothetical protein
MMMKYLAAVCVLVMLCAGCDSYRDVAGPEPDTVNLKTGTYDILYEVTGTYASCQIIYRNQKREVVSTQETALPWTRQFKVLINNNTGLFEAQLSATCADPTKLGKSTVVLLVDADLKARSTATGFGATAKVDHHVGLR